MKNNLSKSSFELNIRPPAITSECPPIYLGNEWEQMSAPKRRGFWFTGVWKVLSTTRRMPVPFSASAILRISKHLIVGFVGVSNQQSLVVGRNAALNFLMSVKSIWVRSMPELGFKILRRYL